MNPYALAFAIATFWRRRQYQLILGRVEAVLDIGLTEIRHAAENTIDAMSKFAAAMGDLEAEERAAFDEATSDIAGRRTSPGYVPQKEAET